MFNFVKVKDSQIRESRKPSTFKEINDIFFSVCTTTCPMHRNILSVGNKARKPSIVEYENYYDDDS